MKSDDYPEVERSQDRTVNGQKPNWSVLLLEEKVPKADEV
jgi:hypothetical protein